MDGHKSKGAADAGRSVTAVVSSADALAVLTSPIPRKMLGV